MLSKFSNAFHSRTKAIVFIVNNWGGSRKWQMIKIRCENFQWIYNKHFQELVRQITIVATQLFDIS